MLSYKLQWGPTMFFFNWFDISYLVICISYVTLFEKSNFCPKIQFWQNPNIFTSFSPKKNRQFSREIKVEFLDKKWRFRTVCILNVFCLRICIHFIFVVFSTNSNFFPSLRINLLYFSKYVLQIKFLYENCNFKMLKWKFGSKIE